MAAGDALLSLFLSSGLAQYPDKDTYNAASLLLPSERPTFPVRAIEPDPKQYPIFRVRPKTEGITNGGKYRTILINKEAPGYKDPRLLASIIAHEAVHATNADTPAQYDEGPAYRQQYDVLSRLNYKKPDYLKALWQRIRAVEEQEKQK